MCWKEFRSNLQNLRVIADKYKEHPNRRKLPNGIIEILRVGQLRGRFSKGIFVYCGRYEAKVGKEIGYAWN